MKEWNAKVSEIKRVPYQNVVLHQFKVEGSQRYFRMGKVEPEFTEGQWIKFRERNSNVEIASIEVGVEEARSESVTPMTSTQESSSPPSTAGDVGQRLRYQAARHDATLLAVAMLRAEANNVEILPWSKSTAKNKRLDLFMGYVEEITKTLLKQESSNA